MGIFEAVKKTANNAVKPNIGATAQRELQLPRADVFEIGRDVEALPRGIGGLVLDLSQTSGQLELHDTIGAEIDLGVEPDIDPKLIELLCMRLGIKEPRLEAELVVTQMDMAQGVKLKGGIKRLGTCALSINMRQTHIPHITAVDARLGLNEIHNFDIRMATLAAQKPINKLLKSSTNEFVNKYTQNIETLYSQQKTA